MPADEPRRVGGRPSWRDLLLVGVGMGVALAVRVAVVLASTGLPLTSDPADYVRHAVSIAAGHGYPPSVVAPGSSALRPPGFPWFLGGVFALTGDSEIAARLAQAVVGTVIVALTGAVAALVWGRVAGLVAIGLAALYPPLIVGGAALLSEPLFTMLMLAAVVATLVHRRDRRARSAAAAGVLAGLAVLTRPNGALLVLVLAGAVGQVRARGLLGAARMPALLVAAAFLTVAPWTLRNAVVLHAFVPVSTNGGYTLAGTYNDTSRTDQRFPGAWRPPNLDPAMTRLLTRLRGAGEVEADDALGAAARRYARARPGYVVSVGGHNLARLVNLGGRDFHRLATRAEVGLGPRWSDAAMYGFFPFALLAVVGAASPAARAAPRFLWLVPLAMATVVFVLASQRFRVPIDPFILLLATAAVCWPLGARAARRR
jgi:4-amino-4-deoxy-L-arabinose transferase-like glycosyltransferase